MSDGTVIALCIAPHAGSPMHLVEKIQAIAGQGLEGDRYARGEGSFNKNDGIGFRQVTLINEMFFFGTDYDFVDSRRNIVTKNVELNRLIGKTFKIGNAVFRGLKYCRPCTRPTTLNKEKFEGSEPFNEAFHDTGGLIAEVRTSGEIKTGDTISIVENEGKSTPVCPTCGNTEPFKVPNSDHFKCHVCTTDIISPRS